VIIDSGNKNYRQGLMIGTATTGLVRIEWHQSRCQQLYPSNWTVHEVTKYLDGIEPLRFQVADAQNVICGEFVKSNCDWLILWEHDCCPGPDALIKFNQYMQAKTIPIVSALYYTRSVPSEPLIYRGRGNGCFLDWKPGDKVWADGCGAGLLLIHGDLIRTMWNDAEEYLAEGVPVRRVFKAPNETWTNPYDAELMLREGTSDLDWCTRVRRCFGRAGWPDYQDKEWPILIDTQIIAKHYGPDGTCYPDDVNKKDK
jgi:hypothetical protein